MKERVKKWTPGPWKVDDLALSIWCTHKEKGDHKILDIRGWGFLTGKGHGALGLDPDEAEETQKANGTVAAAAPYLVEALEDLLASNGGGDKSCGHDFTCVCAEDKAKEALSQAYGETQ